MLDAYLETVREIERRVNLASSRDLSMITVPEAPMGELNAFGDQVDLMFDLIALAYQADLTRVASYIMVAEGRTEPTTTSGCRTRSTRCRITPTRSAGSRSS